MASSFTQNTKKVPKKGLNHTITTANVVSGSKQISKAAGYKK